jgi:DNA-binding LacI/PurR family transcriptional regulator
LNSPTNIKQLAELAGVTAGTVSRALPVRAGSAPKRVSGSSHWRKSWVISPISWRNMRMRRTSTVGMLVPLGHDDLQHLSDPFFNTMSGYLADALADQGYDLLLSRVIPSDGRWIENYARSGRVDGVLIIGQSNQLAVIEATSLAYHPMVVWGSQVLGQHHCSVGSTTRGRDDGGATSDGARLSTHRLYGAGRRAEFGARLDGVRQALAIAGRGEELQIMPSHCEPAAAYDDALGLLRALPVMPDGVAAASDVTAISVIRALGTMGLRARTGQGDRL